MGKAFDVSVDVALTSNQVWDVIDDPCAVRHVWTFPCRVGVEVCPSG
jgi:hypothetical protein